MIREVRLCNTKYKLAVQINKLIFAYSEFNIFDIVVINANWATYFMTGDKTYSLAIAQHHDLENQYLSEIHTSHYGLAFQPNKTIKYDMESLTKYNEKYTNYMSGIGFQQVLISTIFGEFTEFNIHINDELTQAKVECKNPIKILFDDNRRVVNETILTFAGTRCIDRKNIVEPFVENVA